MSTTPLTMKRRVKMYITRIGIRLSMTAALSSEYSWKYPVENLLRPSVTVFILSVLTTSKGQKYSFQVQRNLIIRNVTIAVFTMGTMILVRIQEFTRTIDPSSFNVV